MFKCEFTGEQVKPGISPVRVVVARYGPEDYVTKFVDVWDYEKRRKVRRKRRISLHGQIKKELKVAPWNAQKLKPVPVPEKPPKAPEFDEDEDKDWKLSYKNYRRINGDT